MWSTSKTVRNKARLETQMCLYNSLAFPVCCKGVKHGLQQRQRNKDHERRRLHFSEELKDVQSWVWMYQMRRCRLISGCKPVSYTHLIDWCFKYSIKFGQKPYFFFFDNSMFTQWSRYHVLIKEKIDCDICIVAEEKNPIIFLINIIEKLRFKK